MEHNIYLKEQNSLHQTRLTIYLIVLKEEDNLKIQTQCKIDIMQKINLNLNMNHQFEKDNTKRNE